MGTGHGRNQISCVSLAAHAPLIANFELRRIQYKKNERNDMNSFPNSSTIDFHREMEEPSRSIGRFLPEEEDDNHQCHRVM